MASSAMRTDNRFAIAVATEVEQLSATAAALKEIEGACAVLRSIDGHDSCLSVSQSFLFH